MPAGKYPSGSTSQSTESASAAPSTTRGAVDTAPATVEGSTARIWSASATQPFSTSSEYMYWKNCWTRSSFSAPLVDRKKPVLKPWNAVGLAYVPPSTTGNPDSSVTSSRPVLAFSPEAPVYAQEPDGMMAASPLK